MPEMRREFSPEFKREAVALLESSGRPLMQVTIEVGIWLCRIPIASSRHNLRFPVAEDQAVAAMMRFSRAGMPSISILTLSPAANHTGGLRAKPTPDGVPVTMTSPGWRVMISLTSAMMRGRSPSRIVGQLLQMRSH